MALVLENRWARDNDPRRGFVFEREVRDYLQKELPSSYTVLRGPILTLPSRPGTPEGWTAHEVDFVLAGPNGLFLLEAKNVDSVVGILFNDHWTYQRRRDGRITSSDPSPDAPGRKMRLNLTKANQYVKRRGKDRFEDYRWTRGVFVFPTNSDILMREHKDDPPRRNFGGDYWFAELAQLAKLIQAMPPPPPRGTGSAKLLTATEANALVRLFYPGTFGLDLEPGFVADYEIATRNATQLTSNGLRYRVCKLKHTSLRDAKGKGPLCVQGKWYDMQPVDSRERELFKEQVRRHANVGTAIRHPNVHLVLDFREDPTHNGSWVFQDWIEGQRLEEIIDTPIRRSLDIKEFMRQMANGIRAIHAGGFVLRELSPSSIIVAAEDGRPVLTDFELAKAYDGRPTVSFGTKFEPNPYRAPEVAGDRDAVAPRTDVFSWAAIFLHLATGEQPHMNTTEEELGAVGIPSTVRSLVIRCLAPSCDERPINMDEVIPIVKRWR